MLAFSQGAVAENSGTVSFPDAVVSGDLLVAIFASYNGSNLIVPPDSILDSQDNEYDLVYYGRSGDIALNYVAFYICQSANEEGTAATVTVPTVFSGSGYANFYACVMEYTGNPGDVSSYSGGISYGTGEGVDEDTVTLPSADGQLVIAFGVAPTSVPLAGGTMTSQVASGTMIAEDDTSTVSSYDASITLATPGSSYLFMGAISLVVTDPSIVIDPTDEDYYVQAGIPQTAPFSASGGTSPYTWSVVFASPGLTVTIQSTGDTTASVTMTVDSSLNQNDPYTLNFTIQAEDADGNVGQGTGNVIFTSTLSPSLMSYGGKIRKLTKTDCLDEWVTWNLDFTAIPLPAASNVYDSNPKLFISFPELTLTDQSIINEGLVYQPPLTLNLPVGRVVNRLNGLKQIRSFIYLWRPNWGYTPEAVNPLPPPADLTNNFMGANILLITNPITGQTVSIPSMKDIALGSAGITENQAGFFVSGAVPFFGDDSLIARLILVTVGNLYGVSGGGVCGKLTIMFCDWDVNPYQHISFGSLNTGD